MPGLGYLQGEPLHPITWASQQHSGIGEKLHPSSDGPPEDQAWSNGRGDFFFKSFFSAVERRDCCHPPHPSFFFNLGPPPSSSAYTLFVFYPLVLLEALTGISNLHVWQFVPAWIWRLGGGECLDGCVCESAFVLSAVCFLMEVAHCTHTHIYTHMRPSMGKPTVQCSVIVGYAWLGGGWVGGCLADGFWCVTFTLLCVCVCVFCFICMCSCACDGNLPIKL